MKLAIGGDHAGFEYKQKIIKYLKEAGHEVKDYGSESTDSVDYPDFAHPLSAAVEQRQHELGILICGSANGVAMTANKHQGIRAAICWNEELATLARQHNDANIICLPARFIDYQTAEQLVEKFINEPFEGGRHKNRVDKISC